MHNWGVNSINQYHGDLENTPISFILPYSPNRTSLWLLGIHRSGINLSLRCTILCMVFLGINNSCFTLLSNHEGHPDLGNPLLLSSKVSFV